MTAIDYTIRPSNPAAHLFAVSCTVRDPDPAGQRFALPAWIPGSYLIRDFARHIVAIDAQADGRPLALVDDAEVHRALEPWHGFELHRPQDELR